MKIGIKKFLAKISVLLYGLPFVASAQSLQGQLPSPVEKLSDIGKILCTVAVWLFNILIFMAIIFAIYAAFLYLTAGGEEEKIKKANHTLVYVAVAVAVALMARGIPFLVANLFGATGVITTC